MKMIHFLTVDDGTVIHKSTDDSYMIFISNNDVCTDGSGAEHGDLSHLDETAYVPTLNADKDYYSVLHPKMRTGVKPVVLGCQGRVTNLKTREWHWCVWGEVGPQNKAGENAIVLAQHLNPKVSANDGDESFIYLYECWPGVAAVVGEKHYKLIPC